MPAKKASTCACHGARLPNEPGEHASHRNVEPDLPVSIRRFNTQAAAPVFQCAPMPLHKMHGSRKRSRSVSPVESNVGEKRRKLWRSGYPPHVWDSLPQIKITRKTLAEFDSRIEAKTPQQTRGTLHSTPRLLRSDTNRLKRLANSGAMDYNHLRGYAETSGLTPLAAMEVTNSVEKPAGPTATGPYDAHFEALLIASGVYPHRYLAPGGRLPPPRNLAYIRETLDVLHPSLSSRPVVEEDFENFVDVNNTAEGEPNVMIRVYPMLVGPPDTTFTTEFDRLMGELCLFHPNITHGKPDAYDGNILDLREPFVRDLRDFLVPSNATKPAGASNYFMEVKGTHGRSDVLKRQVLHDGALGARAMFVLQNYGQDEPLYDGNAYALVSSYNAGEGTLRLHATYPSRDASGQTVFQLTDVNTYNLTGDVESFNRGISALRNARDFCRREREQVISNAKAQRAWPINRVPAWLQTMRDQGKRRRSVNGGQGQLSKRRVSQRRPSSNGLNMSLSQSQTGSMPPPSIADPAAAGRPLSTFGHGSSTHWQSGSGPLQQQLHNHASSSYGNFPNHLDQRLSGYTPPASGTLRSYSSPPLQHGPGQEGTGQQSPLSSAAQTLPEQRLSAYAGTIGCTYSPPASPAQGRPMQPPFGSQSTLPPPHPGHNARSRDANRQGTQAVYNQSGHPSIQSYPPQLSTYNQSNYAISPGPPRNYPSQASGYAMAEQSMGNEYSPSPQSERSPPAQLQSGYPQSSGGPSRVHSAQPRQAPPDHSSPVNDSAQGSSRQLRRLRPAPPGFSRSSDA